MIVYDPYALRCTCYYATFVFVRVSASFSLSPPLSLSLFLVSFSFTEADFGSMMGRIMNERRPLRTLVTWATFANIRIRSVMIYDDSTSCVISCAKGPMKVLRFRRSRDTNIEYPQHHASYVASAVPDFLLRKSEIIWYETFLRPKTTIYQPKTIYQSTK